MSKTFAELENNIVINVLIADTLEGAEIATGATCVEYTNENPAAVGWSYDNATGIFTAPVIEEPPVEA